MSRYITRITELLEPQKGKEKGICVFCGRYTEHGHRIKLSDNFTAWNLLEEGEVICEYCYALIKNQDFRRHSWVLSEEGVKYLKKGEILTTLLNPPEPPFTIYITKTGKKQGFLDLINRVNYSNERYFIAFDDKLIFVNRVELKKMVDIAKEARKLNFSKSELLGDIKVKHYEHEDLVKKVLEQIKKPVWEVVVYGVE